VKRGDYATACPKFAESFRLDPAAGTSLNLAQCEDKLGMFASAAQHYQETLDMLSPGDSRLAVAKAGLASAKKRAPKLTVRLPDGAPPGTVVLRDGVELGDVSIGTALPIDPGEHTLVTKAPGYEDHTETVTIAAGESKETTIAIGAPLPEPEPTVRTPGKAPDPSTPSPDVEPSSSMLPYVLGGVGLVSLGAGTYFVFLGESLDADARADGHFYKSDSTGLYCDAVCFEKTKDSRSATTLGYGFLLGGGLLVAGGVAMILLAPSHETDSTDEPSVNVAIGHGSVGAQVGGAW
jgi:hypothetical protein